MARRISSSGRVTVSERRSIQSVRWVGLGMVSSSRCRCAGAAGGGLEPEAHADGPLDLVGLFQLDGDLGEQQDEGDVSVEAAAGIGGGKGAAVAGEGALAARDAGADVGGGHGEALARQELGPPLVEIVGIGVDGAGAGEADGEGRGEGASLEDGVLDLAGEELDVAAQGAPIGDTEIDPCWETLADADAAYREEASG